MWLLFLFCAFSLFNSGEGQCKAINGKTCIKSVDRRTGKTRPLCFTYQKWQICRTSSRYYSMCNCSEECGCTGEDDEPEVTVRPTNSTKNKLACDSSSVESFGGCKDLKKVFCPLTMTVREETVNNTLCEYCGENKKRCYNSICQYNISSQADKDYIVQLHNEARAYVAYGEEKRGYKGPQPPASNMNKLSWDDDLALSAQMWALQCPDEHDKNRLTPEFKNYPYVWVGQNIAFTWTSVKSSTRVYESMVKGWYDEVRHFNKENVQEFASKSNKAITGHYTAMVWAETTKVGCGFVQHYDKKEPSYPYKQTLICNYGSGGNIRKQAVYKIGRAGSECPNGHEDGLCV